MRLRLKLVSLILGIAFCALYLRGCRITPHEEFASVLEEPAAVEEITVQKNVITVKTEDKVVKQRIPKEGKLKISFKDGKLTDIGYSKYGFCLAPMVGSTVGVDKRFALAFGIKALFYHRLGLGGLVATDFKRTKVMPVLTYNLAGDLELGLAGTSTSAYLFLGLSF